MASIRPLVHPTAVGVRTISTSSACCSLRNFRKIALPGFRGSRRFRERMKENPGRFPEHDFGVKQPGYMHNGKFHLVPEMIPELIVPDLTGFQLKPYVSYKVADVVQGEFTAKDLFNAIYAEKIVKDFQKGKLDEEGNPKEPNDYETLTPEEAMLNARKTGSDYFDYYRGESGKKKEESG